MTLIDYQAVRARITLSHVLELIEFVPTEQSGDQLRGPCPIHGSTSQESRSFSANLRKNAFRCFQCGTTGNQLDLWMAISGLGLYAATLELCRRLGFDISEFHPRRTTSNSQQLSTEKRNP